MPDTIQRLATCSRQLLDVGAEIERMRGILAEINRIVHVPTPGRMPADVHFQRDFDKIRKLTDEFTATVSPRDQNRAEDGNG